MQTIIDANRNRPFLRIKGIIFVRGEPKPLVVQGVLDTYTIAPQEGIVTAKSSTVVIIGQDLDEFKTQDGLAACVQKQKTM